MRQRRLLSKYDQYEPSDTKRLLLDPRWPAYQSRCGSTTWGPVSSSGSRGPVALAGAFITWFFIADLTGLDLAEQVRADITIMPYEHHSSPVRCTQPALCTGHRC